MLQILFLFVFLSWHPLFILLSSKFVKRTPIYGHKFNEQGKNFRATPGYFSFKYFLQSECWFFFQQHGYPRSYPLINILWKWWWTWLIEVLCLRGTGVEENADVVPGDGLETSKLMGGWFVQRRNLQIVQMKFSFYVFFCVGNNNCSASSWL